ncbi:Ricin B lectin [Candidatus Magnetomorum sp. HK-1]|nr:Ricin B lectin [Candidatus Magnetomorum sp. HK-1]
MIDVNGDQMADVIGFGNAGVYVSVSKATKFRIFRLCLNTFGYNAGWRVDSHPRMMADVDE